MGAKVLPSGPCQLIQQAKFIYSKKKTKKKVETLKSLKFPNKIDNLKKDWEFISKKSVEWFDYW